MIFLLALLSTFFIGLNSASASSSNLRFGKPSQTWVILKSPNFDVFAQEKHTSLGAHYAQNAEKALSNLKQLFIIEPERIALVISDNTDSANAYATRLPYPHIVVFPVPTSEQDSISESSGNWAYELLVHELTHILQMEPAGGFYKVLRPIFGSIISPNMLMPSWWKEGMAVEAETRLSPRGRLRSAYQDASLRAFVLSDTLFSYTLDNVNEELPSWPYGARPYLFGSLFFSQLEITTKNPNSSTLTNLNHLTKRQGERLPYFIQTPMLEAAGVTYEELYAAALKNVQSNGLEQIKDLETIPTSKITFLSENNLISDNPSFSDSHQLLAYLEQKQIEKIIRVFDLSKLSNLEIKNAPSGNIQDLIFHPTDKKIIYSKIDSVSSSESFSDLHIYDLETEISKPLTHMARARSPQFSKNGNELVFVTTESAKTQIRILDLNTEQIRFVTESDFETRYLSPVFWENSETLLFIKILPDGNSELIKYNLSKNTEEIVKAPLRDIRFLRVYEDKLFFISAQNGVNNIYESSDLKTYKPVTHLLTGSSRFTMEPKSKKIWASIMTSNGLQVAEITPSEKNLVLPQITNKIAERYNYSPLEQEPINLEQKEYSPFPYIWPKYWIPFLSTSSNSESLFFQAETAGKDPLGIHQYSLVASYDSYLKKGNFNGLYINSNYSIPFSLSSTVQNFALGTIADIVQTSTYAFAIHPDAFSINKNLQLAFGLQVKDTLYTSYTQHGGFFAQTTYKNYTQNIFQISPESGWGGLARIEKNFKTSEELPNTAIDYHKLLTSWLGFWSKGLPAQHALKLKWSGLFTFEPVLGRFGTSSTSYLIDPDGLIPQFTMRAYPSSQFFGRTMWNTNLEYRFPIAKIQRGDGTSTPLFLNRLSGALIADGLGVDGAALAENLSYINLKANESIWNTGVEFKLDSTLGYIFPVTFVFGYYIPHSPLFASTSSIGISLQMGGF